MTVTLNVKVVASHAVLIFVVLLLPRKEGLESLEWKERKEWKAVKFVSETKCKMPLFEPGAVR